MKRKIVEFFDRLKRASGLALASLEQPWRGMKLSTEEVAARRRSRLEQGDQHLLWRHPQRGFW